MLGSLMNVWVSTNLNKWEVFTTEIEDVNYNDLQTQNTTLTDFLHIAITIIAILAAILAIPQMF
jgi:hypothetical protein